MSARALALVAAALVCGACSSSQGEATPSAPTREVVLLTREGYAEAPWIDAFQRASGCRVRIRYADTTPTLAAAIETQRFDVATVPGEIALELADHGLLARIDPRRVPQQNGFYPVLRRPRAGVSSAGQYGVAFLWTPNLLLWRRSIRKTDPTSWQPLIDARRIAVRGRQGTTTEDTPMVIADAAIALRSTTPALGITDPFALSEQQFEAVLPLVYSRMHHTTRYWQVAQEQVDALATRLADVGTGGWYQQSVLGATAFGVVLPHGGTSASLDLWGISANAQHVGCAYRLIAAMSRPGVQAAVARSFGSTPSHPGACALMPAADCRRVHADALPGYVARLAFRRSPSARCQTVPAGCVPYSTWVETWNVARHPKPK